MGKTWKRSLHTRPGIDKPRSESPAQPTRTRKIAWRPAAEMLEPRSLMVCAERERYGHKPYREIPEIVHGHGRQFHHVGSERSRHLGFQALINWGDGSTSAGKIKANKHFKGTFTITGTHDYKDGISDQTITITVNTPSIASVAIGQPAEGTVGPVKSGDD